MTKFEKDFLLQCLDSIATIISDKEEIKRVVLIFSQGNEEDPRYQIQSKITDSADWTAEEKIVLSAAVFEATARASFQFCTREVLTSKVEAATTLLRDRYLSLITQNTESDNRLASVRKNIDQIKLQIDKEPVEVSKHYSDEGSNPYTFFKVAAVVGLGLAAITTVAFTR
ncbi:hypothetical protein [Legionella fallonii]|uniref:Uncharacterized protein n=1 Tax=Legionella fallonii LLAP-10 TaxID=1212491 RepID=A0A098GAR9_9GAMM|nr:hypothetical protein [Legionella fallonii]CEG58580.1 conserved protein of unknown function [Legionella fallonii LLAP-10]